VSLQPPLVSFCLNRRSSSWPAVSVTDHVAVHVLTDAQEHLARTFATSGIDRFAEPVDGEHLTDDSPPLLYHMGRYLQLR
jgi:flavin reductase (DIM6/NTAB) family NADH-FMN oxidoreductase RutF